jgi:hypothetical protein
MNSGRLSGMHGRSSSRNNRSGQSFFIRSVLSGSMELRNLLSILSRQFMLILFFIIAFCFAIPLLIGFVLGISSGLILSLIFSTFLLQATASPAGVALDLPPAVIMAVMTSYAVGMTLAIQEICITFSQTSERVKRWLDKVEAKMQKYTFIHRYGAVSCTFHILDPGAWPVQHPGHCIHAPVEAAPFGVLHGFWVFPGRPRIPAPDARHHCAVIFIVSGCRLAKETIDHPGNY